MIEQFKASVDADEGERVIADLITLAPIALSKDAATERLQEINLKLPPLPRSPRHVIYDGDGSGEPLYSSMQCDARCTAAVLADRAAREETVWQPIATAAKDGRTLLLGHFNCLGNWRTVRGQWMSESYIAESWEDPDDVEPGWFETSVEADDTPNCWPIDPTHWMPLPAAPNQERGGDDE